MTKALFHFLFPRVRLRLLFSHSTLYWAPAPWASSAQGFQEGLSICSSSIQGGLTMSMPGAVHAPIAGLATPTSSSAARTLPKFSRLIALRHVAGLVRLLPEDGIPGAWMPVAQRFALFKVSTGEVIFLQLIGGR